MKFIISNNPENHQETYHVFYIDSYLVVALSEKDAQIAFFRYKGLFSEAQIACFKLKSSDIIDFNICLFYPDGLIDKIVPTLNGNRGKVVAFRGDGLHCADHFYWVRKGLNEVQNEN